MPELPDVEVFKRYLDSTALRKQIKSVSVETADILKGVSSRSIQQQLNGKKFTGTRRHGKHLFVAFTKDKWLVMHFGMTGYLEYYKDGDAQPDYSKVIFHFANGFQLAYVNRRKLGFITITDDMEKYIQDNDLGPDPLNDKWNKSDFIETYSDRAGSVKAGLMNQSVMAGIGNVYSDETLFQAGIKPQKKLKQLSEKDLGQLFTTMKRVVKKAIDWKVDPKNFSNSYLLLHREPGDECPRCGGKIKKQTVSGRSSYFCPSHQK